MRGTDLGRTKWEPFVLDIRVSAAPEIDGESGESHLWMMGFSQFSNFCCCKDLPAFLLTLTLTNPNPKKLLNTPPTFPTLLGSVNTLAHRKASMMMEANQSDLSFKKCSKAMEFNWFQRQLKINKQMHHGKTSSQPWQPTLMHDLQRILFHQRCQYNSSSMRLCGTNNSTKHFTLFPCSAYLWQRYDFLSTNHCQLGKNKSRQ